jgi:hypothetical protein
MMKAYDRVEWEYLHGCLVKLGFAPEWIQSVMRCVTCVRYAVRVNGELTEPVVHLGAFVRETPLAPTCSYCVWKGCHVYCKKRRTVMSSMESKMVDSAPLSHIYCLQMTAFSLHGVTVGACRRKRYLEDIL